jgi:hypothetical protein
MKLLLYFFLAFSLISPYAMARDCIEPTQDELMDFFDGVTHWTEVVQGTNTTPLDSIVSFHINFQQPLNSVVTVDGSPTGRIVQVCLARNGINLVGRRGLFSATIEIMQTADGLKSRLRGQEYHYLPTQLAYHPNGQPMSRVAQNR